MRDLNNVWWVKKHRQYIKFTDFSYEEFRKKIFNETLFKPNMKNEETIFNWNEIMPNYSFFFDFEGKEKEIAEQMRNSQLIIYPKVYIETSANTPVIEVDTAYYINNWNDFERANSGMGIFVVTKGFELLMEFTDDAKYLLFSNFKIK